jgi:hypothetical protein
MAPRHSHHPHRSRNLVGLTDSSCDINLRRNQLPSVARPRSPQSSPTLPQPRPSQWPYQPPRNKPAATAAGGTSPRLGSLICRQEMGFAIRHVLIEIGLRPAWPRREQTEGNQSAVPGIPKARRLGLRIEREDQRRPQLNRPKVVLARRGRGQGDLYRAKSG